MSTELEERLQRLAADVDVEAGRAEQRARQQGAARRHRGALGVGIAAACAVVVGAAVVVARAQPSGESGPQAASEDGDVLAGEGTEVEPRPISTEQDGLVVTVTAPAVAPAGTRLWFDVVIRNEGEGLVHWEAGGCTIPIRAIAGPASSVAFDPSQPSGEDPRWAGEIDGLPSWLAEHNALDPSQYFQAADSTAARSSGCPGDSRMAELPPGDEVRTRGSVELRVPPGDLPDGGNYELLVEFQPYPGVDPQAGTTTLDPVVVRVPLTVTDDPARTAGSGDEAIGAFVDDPRLADWVESMVVTDAPDLDQEFVTELSWWRGGWELWVEPYWQFNRLLRMRYDPEPGEVVDVRTVYLGTAPEDDPDAVVQDFGEPNEIL
jgi:hypothetical protein